MKVTFLEAALSLTKSYSLSESGEITKSNYPNVAKFTSHEEQCATLAEFYTQLVAHAKLGHCLLKGNTNGPLINQSRAGSTISNAVTRWLCLDFDKAPFKTVEEALAAIHELNKESPFKDVGYVVQYSASHGIPGSQGLNCHVFIQLSQEIHAPYLKAWLMQLNLKCKALSDGITLSASNATLSWPLDITTCQNDKLLFITPPELSPALVKKIGKAKFNEAERYQLVSKKLMELPIERISSVDLNSMKQAAHKRKNEMRKAKGMEHMRTQPKLEGDVYTILSPGEAVITSELRQNNDYVNFNINGGDSWSYGHHVDNYEHIYCFKHPDERFRTKELLPQYYAQCERERIAKNAAPTAEGDIILAFSDFKSSSYWRGLWNPQQYKLDIAQVSGVQLLNDWRKSFGRDELEFTPIWNMRFDPTTNVVVDEVAKTVNTYVANKFMRNMYTPNPKAKHNKCPTIIKTMLHVLNFEADSPEFEHWLNWLAVVYQKRIKTQTAWVLSGTEGTGKGVLGTNILAATMGDQYVSRRMGNTLEEIYNGWMEESVICVLDEVELTTSDKKNTIHQNMKKYITDSPMPYRHMHRMGYQAASYINFILCTNSKESVHITEDNRRYNIANFQPEKIGYQQADLDAIERELPHWVDYIMTRPADVDMAARIIKTEEHDKLVEVSRNSNEDVADKLQRGDLHYFFELLPNMDVQTELHGLNTAQASMFEALVKDAVVDIVNNGASVSTLGTQATVSLKKTGAIVAKDSTVVTSKLSRDDLFTLFEYSVGNMPSTPAKFTKFLGHRGIKITSVKVDSATVRGVYVRWVVSAAQLEEMKDWLAAMQKPAPTPLKLVKAQVK